MKRNIHHLQSARVRCVIGVFLAVVGSTPLLVAQSATLTSFTDAYVRSGVHQNTNFGTATTLDAKLSAVSTDDFNREIYLKFDLGSVAGIANARLRLFGSDNNAPETITVQVRSSTVTTWKESGTNSITWATKPAVGGTVHASAVMQKAPAWHEWDVTSFVQSEKAAGRNWVTLVLRCSTPSTTGYPVFNARESATNRPQLVVTPTVGATQSWSYYEAENAVASGAVLNTGTTWGDVSFEARGKKSMILSAQGHSLQWSNVRAHANATATHATVRYSIPDGATGTLGLYVNQQWRVNVPLNAQRMREGKSQVPGGVVRLFDDVLVAVPGGIPPAATVTLKKEAADSVAYMIDFLEVETAPAALSVPDSSWVVVNGTNRAAVVAAISTANSGSKKVWFPAGTYTVDAPTIPVDPGIQMRGAGMWHTTIVKNFGGNHTGRLFQISGAGNSVQDMKFVDTITQLFGNSTNCIFNVNDSTDCVLKNIWTEYASLAMAYRATRLVVRDCRVRNGYKDAVHVATSARDCVIENCTFRNTGDDSAAFVSYESPNLLNNTARYNTIELTYWGRGISLLGGNNNRAEFNLVNGSVFAGIYIGLDEWEGTPFPRCQNFVARNNTVIACGNHVNAAEGGAISIWGRRQPASPDRIFSGAVEYNVIIDPPHHGALITGWVGGPTASDIVYFRYNAIEASTGSGQRISTSLSSPSYLVATPNTDL